MRTVILLLAAGASERLGRPKQLVVFDGKTLIRRAVEAALAVRPEAAVAVVVGANSQVISPKIRRYPIEIIQNDGWAGGMGGSIRAGVERVLAVWPMVETVVVSVIDQPSISAAVFEKLILEKETSGQPITASRYANGAFGPPVAFGIPFFEKLLVMGGDFGAKKLVAENLASTSFVDFPLGHCDIDKPEDLASLGWL